MKINKINLKTVLDTPGISGRESKIREIVKKSIKKNGLELSFDNLGSIWGTKLSKNKNAKTIMIDAHMDEVGFMVTNIDKRGFISFESVGGVWPATLNTQRLRVWTDDYEKSFTGVVELPGANTHQGTGGNVKIENMLLDIGAESDKEVAKWGISVGSAITFDSEVQFNGNRVISKAIDNRLGVYSVLEVMNFIKDKEFDFNIVIGCTVQEENGLIGARTSSYMIDADLAIVIDVSPATDIPAGPQPKGILGEGTMLRHKDARTIYSRKVVEYLRKILKDNKIKYQDYFSLGGTNAGNIHLSKEGIKTIPIGLVARNLHTASTVFDLRDLDETLKLLEAILNDLNSAKINKL